MINYKIGDIITIYYNILDNNKIKKSFFKGIILNIKGKKKKKSLLLKNYCNNIGILRIFFLKQKNIIKIIINKINKKKIYNKKSYFLNKKNINI
ncbi:MAG: 50S ribosomal protein L19 [Candidatus Shikimatogenerans sp. Tcar]|uniref:Large ribosomal subunit protein bL19 n=1 Tax=Candidatus Shikimatogenerans sp. Tcar TaxID=3158565 RepID=A0AAU7QSG5_9FLAO